MLSIVIPALNEAARIGAAVARFDAARRRGLVAEVIVVDSDSPDGTTERAKTAGALTICSAKGRGAQLSAGARAASASWLLFLHADTRLGAGWEDAVRRFIGDEANLRRAAYFRFRLDDARRGARILERLVAWRCRRLRLPYGDQGLLIARDFYEERGGYKPLPLMEDVDFVRRIGSALVPLEADAITSAARYRKDGYVLRPMRNALCLGLYFAGVSPRTIARLYHG